MSLSAYFWGAVVVLVLFLIGRILRWWNLPRVVEARVERFTVWQKERTERLRIRREHKKKQKDLDVTGRPRKKLFRRRNRDAS